ncbi:tetratricopeptide repeat protein [uncultured Aureimonas sp.]|uniref:tetratricopeptide repeat protein n=1 Tax=uncultured Aureimonas sp. TaxID=1604662 RepID=UPI0025F1BB17|nr:tetratricopeptide repeat protein [uncultured Aureimonas sp.]
MTLLNGFFPSATEQPNVLAISGDMTDAAFDEMAKNDRLAPVIEGLRKGLTLADLLDLTPAHIEALMTQAVHLVQAGQFAPARDLLLRAMQLSPLEARSSFVMGMTYQLEGDLPRAAHFYMQFIALDATNPDGYLRLGECLLAAGERDNARDALNAARAFALDGKGRAGALAQAERLLASLGDA